MYRFIVGIAVRALLLILTGEAPAENTGQPKIDAASLAEDDLAAESSGDMATARALYRDDAIVPNGGLCWTACVGKAAIKAGLDASLRPRTASRLSGSTCQAMSRWLRPSCRSATLSPLAAPSHRLEHL
jgi:hypothetical protein